MSIATVLGTELLKLRRSRITWITFAVYAAMAAVAGLFQWMMKDPSAARTLGLMGQKATLAFGGQPVDWPTFLGFIVEMGGLGGLLMSAVIAAWVFGREYAEGTAKNMLALPVPRWHFVAAKIVVCALWLGLLTAWMLAAAVIAGALIQLPGLTASVLAFTAGRLFGLAAMCLACAPLVAWVAVQTRGYFGPLGFAIGTLVLASVFGHTGWGPWVPWSIIGLCSGAAGPVTGLGAGSAAVVAGTFVLGTALTLGHEMGADNAQ